MSNDALVIESSISEQLQNSGIYVFIDDIDGSTIKPVIEWILYENYVVKRKKKELILMICSSGGNLQEAFALIDVMNSSVVPIKTVGLGSIASCGLLIFMSGSVGRRVLTSNTSILSHQFSWHTEGKAHELFATIKEMELTHRRMIDLYKKCTGADDSTIKDYLLPAQDIWLSAQDALKLHICDQIIESTDSIKSSK